MHPVQATETIQWAEKQHQDLVVRAERDQLVRSLHQRQATPSTIRIGQLVHPMRFAAVAMLLMAVLAVAAA
jgi:hypothetical protein